MRLRTLALCATAALMLGRGGAAQTVQTHSLPTTDALLDSAALVAAARALMPPASGKATFLLIIDSAGGSATVRPLVSRLDTAVVRQLADSIRARFRPQAAWLMGRWWARLELAPGERPTARVARPQITAPRSLPKPTGSTRLMEALRSNASAAVRYRMLVDSAGAVLRVVPGAATSPTVGEALIGEELSARYTPGRVDGIPQPLWIEQTIGFRVSTDRH